MRRRAIIDARLAVLVALVSLPLAISSVRGEEAPRLQVAVEPPAGAEPVLRFRRVFAPSDALDECRDDVPYVPMKAGEFDALVDRVRARSQRGVMPTAVLVAAKYEARLEEDTLIGSASYWEFEHFGDYQQLVPLEPLGIALSQATWEAPDGETVELGYSWQHRAAMVVDRPGRVYINWSARGEEDLDGTLRFDLSLPPCPSNELLLTLPMGLRPAPNQGFVLPASPAEDGTPRWRVLFGRQPELSLRLLREEDSSAVVSGLSLRERLVYDVTPQGIDCSLRWSLDVLRDPVERLIVSAPENVAITSVTAEGQPASWRRMPGQQSSGDTVIELAEPLRGANRTVELRAMAPVVTGEPSRLPRIRLEGVFWESATASVLVRRPLVATDIRCEDGRLARIAEAPAGIEGELYELRLFTEDAHVEAALAQEAPHLTFAAENDVRIGPEEMIAEVALEIGTQRGEVFTVRLATTPQWTIDDVEEAAGGSLPSQAVRDWTFKPGDNGPGTLDVTLATPVSPDRSLDLTIRARRLTPRLNVPLASNRLVPLALARRFCLDNQATLEGGSEIEVHVLDAETADGAAEEEGEGPLNGHAFPAELVSLDLLAPTVSPPVMLSRRTPRYDVGQNVRLFVGKSTTRIEYRIEIVPPGDPLPQIPVVIASAEGTDVAQWQWEILDASSSGTDPPTRSSDRAVFEPQQVGSSQIRGLLRLPRPRLQPFVVALRVEIPSTADAAMPMLGFPQARTDSLRLRLFARPDLLPRLHVQGLKRYQGTTTPEVGYRFLDAYRTADDKLAAMPAVRLVEVVEHSAPSAWAWQARVRSRFEASGDAFHQATFSLGNAGDRHVELRYPVPDEAGADAREPASVPLEIEQVTIDGAPGVWRIRGEGDGRALYVEIPPARQRMTLRIEYRTDGEPLQPVVRLAPTLLRPQFEVLNNQWEVWLPPGFRILDRSAYGRFGSPMGSWWRRLFGSLAQQRGSGPLLLDELIERAWAGQSSTQRLPAGKETAQRVAAAWLDQINARVLQARDNAAQEQTEEGGGAGEMPTWSELLAPPGNEDLSLDQDTVRLLVDGDALWEAGVLSDTRCPQPASETDQPGKDLLVRAGLVLAASGDRVVLTSESRLPFVAAPVAHRNSPLVHLDEDGLSAGHSGGGERWPAALTPLRVWCRWSGSSAAQAAAGFVPDDHAAAASWGPTPGWVATCVPLEEDGRTEVLAIDWNTWQTSRWLIFLLSFAFFWWAFERRPRTLIALGLISGAVTVVVPPLVVPITSGVFLGMLPALGVTLLKLPRSEDAPPGTDASGERTHITMTGWLLALMVTAAAVGAAGAAAGEQTAAPAVSSQRTYRVFVPIDENGEPTGDEVHVPEGLYQALHRYASRSTPRLESALITRADYRAELRSGLGAEQFALEEVAVRFELDVLADNLTVAIPLGGDNATVDTSEVLLDGSEVSAVWSSSDPVLRFEVARSGTHYLDLVVKPAVGGGSTFTGVDIPVPPVATAKVTLTVPSDAPNVQFPSARGRVAFDAEDLQWTAQLGATDRLALHWQETPLRAATGAVVDAEQLLWLRVQPGNVLLEAQWNLQVVEGRLQEFTLLTEPRLRPMVAEPEGVEIESANVTARSQVIRFAFPEPVEDRARLRVSFLLRDTTGIGQLKLPTLQPSNVRLTRRLLAVSSVPVLQASEGTAEHYQKTTPSTFLSAWNGASGAGSSSGEPGAVYELPPGDVLWSMIFRPAPVSLQCQESLDVVLTRGPAEYRYAAQFESSAPPWVFRLEVPPNFQVENVSLGDGHTTIVPRWAKSDETTLCVFNNRPTFPPRELRLHGEWHSGGSEPTPLPLVKMTEVESTDYRLALARRPDAVVDITELGDFSEVSTGARAEASPLVNAPVRSVAQLVASKPGIGPTLEVRPNRPEVSAVQTTVLPSEEASDSNGESESPTEVTTWFDVNISGGVVDEFMIESASPLGGGVRVLPETWTAAVSENGRRLRIRPDRAISGEAAFALLIARQPGRTASGIVTSLRLTGARVEVHRLITSADDHALGGQMEKLNIAPEPVPDELRRRIGDAEGLALYSIPQRHLEGDLSLVARSTASIASADVVLDPDSSGGYQGLGQWIVYPGALEEFLVTLPGAAQLLHVWLDGDPITPVPLDGGRWSIPLDDRRGPRRLAMVFRGRQLANTPGREEPLWALPRFASVTPPETRLLVRSLPRHRTVIEGKSPASPIEIDLHRAKSLLDVLEKLLADPARESASGSLARRLQAECESLLDRAEAELAAGLSSQPQWSVTQQIAELRGRLAGVDAPQPAEPGSSTDRRFAEAFHRVEQAVHASQGECYLVAAGEPLQVRWVRKAGPLAETWPSIVTALALLALALLLLLVTTGQRLRNLLLRFPHGCAVLAGLAWWLWLQPSFFGWGLIGVSLWVLIRSRWRAARDGETVVPIIVQQPVASNEQ